MPIKSYFNQLRTTTAFNAMYHGSINAYIFIDVTVVRSKSARSHNLNATKNWKIKLVLAIRSTVFNHRSAHVYGFIAIIGHLIVRSMAFTSLPPFIFVVLLLGERRRFSIIDISDMCSGIYGIWCNTMRIFVSPAGIFLQAMLVKHLIQCINRSHLQLAQSPCSLKVYQLCMCNDLLGVIRMHDVHSVFWLPIRKFWWYQLHTLIRDTHITPNFMQQFFLNHFIDRFYDVQKVNRVRHVCLKHFNRSR